ncbi:hypothetical protein [Alistipes sp.]|uniref:hypothetical protein n=1 Tax=Alistipes sp. TaxID=1872444 RepID=UPI003A879608
MNTYYLIAGALVAVAFFVHVVAGNRFYSSARPTGGRAYDAWLMGRCGMQMIAVDLTLTAAFALLLGTGAIPRNRALELFLWATYCGWTLLWLVSLAAERARRWHYLRLYHWGLFLLVASLLGAGMRA